jgi:glucose uptake protein GlcU
LVTATEGVESVHTTGTPNVVPQTTKSASVGGSVEATGEAEDSSSKYVLPPLILPILLLLLLSLVIVKLTDSKTTIAVSVSVISVAVVVICTVLGLYLYKKRKTKRELEEASQQGKSLMSYPLISILPFAALRIVLMTDHMMAQRDWEY